MKKIVCLLVLSVLFSNFLKAQVSINASGTAPDNSSMLDVQSTSKGVLISKMTLTQRNGISSPAKGLLIYCTDDNRFHYNSGTSASPAWIKLGSVNSVGMSLPAGEFQVSGSPVTDIGSLTATWLSQSANQFFAGPNGAPGTPSFRALVDADVPDNITVSLYLPLTGGTLSGKFNTVASGSSNAGFNLPHGSAPSSPLNGDLWTTTGGLFARINGSTVGPFGIGNGTVTSVTASSPLNSTGGSAPDISLTGTVGISNGGTNLTNYNTGDIIYASGTNTLSKLPAAASGNALLSGTTPSWGKIALTTHVSGTLPVANGGSGTTTLTGYIYGNGTSAFTASTSIPGSAIDGNISGNSSNVTGIVAAINGGTGFNSYAVGDFIYANTTTTFAKLNSVASGSALISNGVGVAPSWGDINLTTTVSGTLPVANGGTNINSIGSAGTVAYSNGSSYNFTAVGASGKALLSNVSGTPVWGDVNLASAVSGTLPVPNGGTNLTSYTTGDMLYASGTTTLSKLTAVASGSALISNGTGVAPSWGDISLTTTVSGILPVANGGTNLNTYATGDLIYASSANTLDQLSAAGSGNALLSGTTPSWGKIALTTHVSGSLPVGNGGTNITSYTIGDLLFASGTTTLSKLTAVASGSALISNGSGVAPSWGDINLTNTVTGTLPVANGGTGISSLTAGQVMFASTTSAMGQSANFAWSGTALTVKSSSTPIIGLGDGISSYSPPSNSGGAFNGNTYGVIGRANNTSGNRFGGYFISATTSGIVTAQVGGYIGTTNYKIIGDGTVSSIVDVPDGTQAIMFCAESPEILLIDYGTGKLINGSCHIEIDPTFSNNIIVDQTNPLKVFVQMEGNCNGVYIENKTKNGFDVIELINGHSNVDFSYMIVAQRKDAFHPDGSLKSKNVGIRFPKYSKKDIE